MRGDRDLLQGYNALRRENMQLMDMQLMENMQLSGYVLHLVAGNSVAAEVKVC